MKKIVSLLLTLLFLFSFLPLLSYAAGGDGAPPAVPLDVGNHNDYDDDGGGGGFIGGYDDDFGGGGGGGTHYYGGGGGSGSISGNDILWIGVALVVLVIFFVIKSKTGHTGRTAAPSRTGTPMPAAPAPVRDNTEEITRAITQTDPLFSPDRFIGWSKEVFVTLQQAWTARDWSRIRPFEKEELFRQHEQQLQEYINLGRINVMERINVNQSYLYKYVRDAEYEYLTVYLAARMGDYIIDEKTRQVIKGDPNREYHMQYLLTYMRKTGVLTNPATSNKSTTSCPHCGAPIQITSAGKCEYCDFIITTGEHDWVLSNLDSIKANTQLDGGGVFLR